MNLLADVLAKVAVGILEWWSARQDVISRERALYALAASELARRALEWKASNPVNLSTDIADELVTKLRDGRGAWKIQSDDSDKTGPK